MLFRSGIGAAAGITFFPVDGLTLAFAWRSGVTLDMEGQSNFRFAPPFDTEAVDRDVKTSVPLPNHLRLGFDYRQIYSELLEHWFGLEAADATQLLGGRFTPLPLIRSVTSVRQAPPVTDFILKQNHPNPVPAGGRTTIPFTLAGLADVEMTLHDMQGRLLASLASGRYSAGRHSLGFQTQGLPPGLYFYRLRVGAHLVSRKMLVQGGKGR